MTPVPPRVMTGVEIGLRVVGLRGDVPVGRLVVRVNDRWVEAELAQRATCFLCHKAIRRNAARTAERPADDALDQLPREWRQVGCRERQRRDA
jgi:hypothetical protein